MKYVVVLLFMAAASAVSDSHILTDEWKTFKLYKLQYGKYNYGEIEDNYRMKIFAANSQKIAKHNERYIRGLESYSLKQNEFGDMLHHEFDYLMNGFDMTANKRRNGVPGPRRGSTFIEPAHVTVPGAVDWREEGAVTAVKNQGHCGSCWAFSSTGALEGQHFRKTGALVSLSEQNLIDCTYAYGNHGCQGGLMENSFRYIKDNGGIDTEATYPYEGMDRACRYNPKNSGAEDVGFVDIPHFDEEKLMQAVATVGPVSVAIDASRDGFQFYSSGIYRDEDCSTTKLNHAVLVVGYGTESNGDYWLVKNSWGTSWGDHGYIKMARNNNNTCGIATWASYPLV